VRIAATTVAPVAAVATTTLAPEGGSGAPAMAAASGRTPGSDSQLSAPPYRSAPESPSAVAAASAARTRPACIVSALLLPGSTPCGGAAGLPPTWAADRAAAAAAALPVAAGATGSARARPKAAPMSMMPREPKPAHTLPALHATQPGSAAVPADAPAPAVGLPMRPGGQPTHAERSVGNKTSGGLHSSATQSASLVAGTADRGWLPDGQEKTPDRHSPACVAPTASVLVPAGHTAQVALPAAPTASLYRPRAQGSQSDCDAGSSPRPHVPAGHKVQDACPGSAA
jgi:hypothetical protein